MLPALHNLPNLPTLPNSSFGAIMIHETVNGQVIDKTIASVEIINDTEVSAIIGWPIDQSSSLREFVEAWRTIYCPHYTAGPYRVEFSLGDNNYFFHSAHQPTYTEIVMQIQSHQISRRDALHIIIFADDASVVELCFAADGVTPVQAAVHIKEVVSPALMRFFSKHHGEASVRGNGEIAALSFLPATDSLPDAIGALEPLPVRH